MNKRKTKKLKNIDTEKKINNCCAESLEYEEKEFEKTMNVRDLIYIGLFTILIAVVTMLVSFIGFIPQLIPLIPIAVGIIMGPIYMLFAIKITKPGMFFISWLLCGAFYGALGHGFWTVGSYAIGGILGEIILYFVKYKSLNSAKIAFSVASVSIIGQMLPMYINKEAFLKKTVEAGYTPEYANKVIAMLPNWSIVPILIGGMITTFIGCTLGVFLLEKYFINAKIINNLK